LKSPAFSITDSDSLSTSPEILTSQYIQLIVIPIFFTFAAFIGIVVTSAGYVLYGSYYWDPLRLIDNWDNRAASFFASFAFALATLGTNISANSISAANDFTALAPRVGGLSSSSNNCHIFYSSSLNLDTFSISIFVVVNCSVLSSAAGLSALGKSLRTPPASSPSCPATRLFSPPSVPL
jgi:hypothetical protein